MAEEIFITGLIAASLRIATPILFAALGETIAERAGVMNLGVEGTMILAAFTSFLTVIITGNHLLGLLAGILIGAFLSFIHAYLSVSLKVNQIVSGLVFTIFGLAMSTALFLMYFGRTVETVTTWETTPIPLLSQIPIIGPALFQQNVLVYAAIILVIVLSILLFRTSWGLAIRAVGENPLAADSLGVRVERMRYICTIFGGVMAGIGGACLSLVNFNSFFANMTAGRGWIAIAIVIFGRWRPSLVLGGSLLFGVLESTQSRLQAMGIPIPNQFILMTPYLLTLVALVIMGRKSRQPAALGVPYVKGEK